ncbi:helix-turn-helix domain-containing protein [Dendronalium sp. ChiSLP03b]|uniref:helix-turn-helix domain-containing protein n=1 Tax=Dendronalium sp. ChiSLP03b TaxID=3075381 RepID=UPI002AD2A820|nr:helix-turn-helix domain-containing protein [Dendronalium sp. ChiSLP03b]MDZ8207129.1 DNA-binding protein [Dendronalium sp. ChiSLP03b]
MLRPGISLVQAARFLGVDQSSLYMALQKGQIPTRRQNGRTVVTSGALMEYQARKQINFQHWRNF